MGRRACEPHRLHNASMPSNLVVYSHPGNGRRFPSPDPTPPPLHDENNESTEADVEEEEEDPLWPHQAVVYASYEIVR